MQLEVMEIGLVELIILSFNLYKMQLEVSIVIVKKQL